MTTWGGPQLPSSHDRYDRPQEPKVEPVDDLSRFVLDRIRDAETEPRADQIPQNHNGSGAWPIAYRYAGYVRQDMVVFRNVVQLYVESQADEDRDPYASGAGYQKGARSYMEAAMLVLANRWSKHPDFREEWRL